MLQAKNTKDQSPLLRAPSVLCNVKSSSFSMPLNYDLIPCNKGQRVGAASPRQVRNAKKDTVIPAKLHSSIARWMSEHKQIATGARNKFAFLKRRWRDISKDEQHYRAFQFAERADGLAISLNLSPLVEERAMKNEDPARYLAKRLNKELRDCGLSGMPFALLLEFSRTGKLHAHGVAVPGDADILVVRKALRNAGGRETKARLPTQLRTKPLHGGAGYLGYAQKGRKQTIARLSDRRFIFMNRPLALAAQDFHENNRPKSRGTDQSVAAASSASHRTVSIGESLARLGVRALMRLGCAVNALSRPSVAPTKACGALVERVSSSACRQKYGGAHSGTRGCGHRQASLNHVSAGH